MMGAVPFNETADDGERATPAEDGAVTRITPGDVAPEIEAAEAVATTPTATGCRFGLTLTARTCTTEGPAADMPTGEATTRGEATTVIGDCVLDQGETRINGNNKRIRQYIDTCFCANRRCFADNPVSCVVVESGQ